METFNALQIVQQRIYKPLPTPRSIRLLTFKPRNSPADPISTELQIFDLDSESCPSYWGLSYTWGNPLPSHSPAASTPVKRWILCNGVPFIVGENLYSFMDRFGGPKKSYWIDAICINQNDIPERNAQVPIMVWIYTKAQGTFIWLGEQDEAAKRSHDLIIKFVKAKNALGDAYSEIYGRRWEFNDPTFFEAMGLEPWSNDDWKAILDFYARSWFHRQWVVQEVVVQDRFVIFCGDQGMEWPNFMFFTQFFQNQSYRSNGWKVELRHIESEFHKAGSPIGIEATYIFAALADGLKKEGPAKKSTDLLLDILSDYRTYSERFHAFILFNVYRMRGRAATDPADHVYAPLSLASRYKRDVDTLPPIDYNSTTVEIYTNFSAHLMRVPRPMVLGFREDDTLRQLQGLPSWVPDFSVHPLETPLSMRKTYSACGKDLFWPDDGGFFVVHFILIKTILRLLQTDSDLLTEVHLVRNSRLYMRGVYVDRVSEVTDEIIPEPTVEALFDLLRLAYYQDPSLNLEPRLESLMRTICANIVEDHSGISKEGIFTRFANWFRLISLNPTQRSRLRESIRDLNLDDWALFWVFGKEPLNPSPGQENQVFPEVEAWTTSADLSEFLSAFIILRRRLALTETRRALALAPRSTRPGDEIWILFNGRTPYVLRKIDGQEDCYYFVGEAYVHGFMYGERFVRDKENGMDVNIKQVVLV